MSDDARNGFALSSGTVRFASLGVGLVLLGLGGKLLLSERKHGSSEILALAEEKGLVPVDSSPKLGTQIYQWDFEIPDVKPYRIGPVVQTNIPVRRRHLFAIQQTKHSRLLIDIRPGEMRYWVLK